jgi:WD40 repeat protein
MGAFYGSIHVRAADHSLVVPHVGHIAKSKSAKFLVAPSIGGWVAVYPENGGQNQRIAAALAKRVGGDVVWISLHDDDVFAYAVWKDGKRLDEYNSCPDYFGPATAAERKRTAGNPSAFSHILPSGVSAEIVKRDLEGDDTEQLEAFARHLGLPNVLTSYDYLMGGETDDVADFSRFVHVPDRTAELATRRRKEAAAAEETERLKAAGPLLCDMTVSEPRAMGPVPRMTSGTRPGEFLYALSDHAHAAFGRVAPEVENDLFHLAPPYSAGPIPVGLRLKPTLNQLSLSSSGKYLAVGHAAGNWSTELWDFTTRTLLHVLPQARAVDFVGFSGNETELLSLSEGTLTILNIRQGTTRQTMSRCRGRAICLHPTDNVIVAGDNHATITLFDATTGLEIQRLSPPPPSPEDQQATIDRLLAGSRGGAVPAEQLKAQENQLRALFAKNPAMIDQDRAFGLRLTSDGTRLICAADHSLRVYDWNALRAATDILPAPLFHVAAETFEHEYKRTQRISTGPVYDAVYVASKRLILFSENSGLVRALNTDTGEVRVLVRPPSRGPIWRLQLSSDQNAIAFAYQPTYEDAMNPTPHRVQIWDIERALAQPLDG